LVPGFRYHLVTIIAIFLALGVGIAIGSSFVQGPLVEQQTRRLDDLKNQYNNQVLVSQESLKTYWDFMSALTPRLIQGRLMGTHIALVQTGDYPDTVRKTREILEQAGAIITSETVVESGFVTRATMVRESLYPKLRAANPILQNDATVIWQSLSTALVRGGHEQEISALADARLIRRDGDYATNNDWIILVGGAADESINRAETIDIPLIAQIKSSGGNVLEVEPKLAAVSYVQALRGSEISTVDHADTDIGRLAVVLALKAERGSYGVKSASQSGILPPFNSNLPVTPSNSTDDIHRHPSP
jgi:hypothetical protein